MKIEQFFLLFVVLVMASCNTPDKPDTGAAGHADTLFRGEANVSLLDKFKTANTFPFTADTTLMFHMETCDSLGTKEVKQLDRNWTLSDSTISEEYILKDFYAIDSVKVSGNYAAWSDSLQPGMTMRSNAYAIGRIAVDTSYQLLIWALSTSTYEACPFTTMQKVYVSIMNDGLVVKTFELAEYISSADPPVAMQRIITGTINKDLTVDLSMYLEGDEDMDLPEVNVTKAYYRLAIKGDKISFLNQKKEGPVKVKRKG